MSASASMSATVSSNDASLRIPIQNLVGKHSGQSTDRSISIATARNFFNDTLKPEEQEASQRKIGELFWKKIGCCSKFWYLLTCRWTYVSLGKYCLSANTGAALYLEIYKKCQGIPSHTRRTCQTPSDTPEGFPVLRLGPDFKKQQEHEKDLRRVVPLAPVGQTTGIITSGTISASLQMSAETLHSCHAAAAITSSNES
jgi:hypothetical protein